MMLRHGLTTRRGLTLLELLVALAITVVTGMAIASVTTAVARGIDTVGTVRSALQRAHAAHVRLRAYTDPGLCLLAYDADAGFALWLEDSRANGRVNLTEFRVFWVDEGTGLLTVERVEFPEGWTDDEYALYDTTLSGVDDPFQVMLTQRSLGYTVTETIADEVAGLSMAYTPESIRDADRVRLMLGLRLDESQTEEILIALALPNHAKPV